MHQLRGHNLLLRQVASAFFCFARICTQVTEPEWTRFPHCRGNCGMGWLYCTIVPFENSWPTASMLAHSRKNALVTGGADLQKKCKLCQQRALARKAVAQCATIFLYQMMFHNVKLLRKLIQSASGMKRPTGQTMLRSHSSAVAKKSYFRETHF